MGDEQVRQAQVSPQVEQQVQDLRLDGDVERRDRFVADDELGTQRQCTRDPDALTLTAAELVGIATRVVPPQPDDLEVVADTLIADAPTGPVVLGIGLGDEALADDVAHRHARVQRADRVLEDELHAPTQSLELSPLGREDVLSADVGRAARGRQESDERTAERRLAAARFAHETEHLAVPDVEADVVDRVDVADVSSHDAARDGEVLHEVPDLDEDPLRVGLVDPSVRVSRVGHDRRRPSLA